jgi:hypothetical protein
MVDPDLMLWFRLGAWVWIRRAAKRNITVSRLELHDVKELLIIS